jgi:hypothetical protein
VLAYLWPQLARDTVEEVIFRLTYQQHGGSGLNWSRADVLACDWKTAMAACERLNQARTQEAKAIRKA